MFNIAPQTMDALIAMGDSIDAGQGNTFGRNRHNQSFSLYSIPIRTYNMGISGSTIGPVSTAASSLARISTIMPLLYNASIRNFIVSTQAGINDLGGGGRTAPPIYSDMVTFGQTAKAFGSNVKVIACTILPSGITGSNSGGGAAETQRLALNTMIRAGWQTWADALCDFDANPIMGVITNLGVASLYADGTHPTALGYSYLANQHAAVVNSLLT
jgi:lysophospholipase L1-like esterase